MPDEAKDVEMILPVPDVSLMPPPPPPPKKRKVDVSNTTRQRAELILYPDGTATQHWLVLDETGGVVGREMLTLTSAEMNDILDNPAERVTSTDGVKRTPLRHIRQEIQAVRLARRKDVVRTQTDAGLELFD